ncbi:MAG: aminotransferase class III-fold pyridoxal phosphate-dependent enzyme, partial [Flavobacteriaceae bacterium]|nr:aminotransferase class III-fold pyridoxal phosphate-dependent enzyme [Flavobacteriaceae bacterium]
MELFDVYSIFNIAPVSAKGHHLTDREGNTYLDLYGGHAVISIGHAHPVYVQNLKEQLDRLAFYSNSVVNPLQQEVADKLELASGCTDYSLFMCNSGAEANENALKLASFYAQKSRIVAFNNGFHGRTSAAVAATDNASIQAPINKQHAVTLLAMNDAEALENTLKQGDVAAIIIEIIQGVGGLDEPEAGFLYVLSELAKKYGALVIADEVQSGFGRTGKFFAYQYYDFQPNIITMAKGMGNGFPVAGLLIHSKIKARKGMLGTTFGGNPLACTAVLSVLEVLEKENLLENAGQMEEYFLKKAKALAPSVRVKGKGLMLGLDFGFPVKELRTNLIYKHQIF